MASPAAFKLTCLALIMFMILALPVAEPALTCGQVQTIALPCLSYLRTGGAVAPARCCNAVRALNNQAKTVPDRQAVCQCLETFVKGIPGLNPAALSSLPAKCGVHLPYQISPTMDCKKVH